MIGIIGAMESEVTSLLAQLDTPLTQTVGGVTFVSGRLAGREVVIARAGIGKVNAAICAHTMCLHYHPTCIVNTGVAGAIGEGLGVGDAVVSLSLAQHDMDTSPLGDPVGLLNLGGENRVWIPADEKIAEALYASAKALGVNVRMGKIVSGDLFIASPAQKERLRTLFDPDACEMEGAAIAHACYLAGVPFCVLRLLSDAADGSAHTDYPTFVRRAARKSADIVRHFVAHFAE